jgi:uncharacterized protein (DUF1778 family)
MARAAVAEGRTERLDARVTPSEKQVIERAANLRGISVTDLLRISVRDAAQRIIQESEVLTLSQRDSKAFVEALMNPPKPNKKLREAAKRFMEEVG